MPDRCPRCRAELTTGANYCARCGAQLGAGASPSAEDPYLGRVLLGRYRVVRALGEGGMGRVYLAEQAMGQATRPVALKTLRKEWMGEPRASGRFLRESEIVIRLAHPNTIQFYDFGQLDDGSLVIVMEYIEGTTLAEALRDGPLPLTRVDALLFQICGSLAEAHGCGIVHRDIKPHNVLLTTRAGYADFVKVVDFGIALQSAVGDVDVTRLTTQGTLVGTPPYMSPEQFQGQVVDARSDVYSLGIVLYQMLTGALPFEAKTPWQWATAHTEHAPQPVSDHRSTRGLAEHSALAVMRALHKDPARRQRDAGELLHEFLGARVVTGASAPAATPSRASPSGPTPAMIREQEQLAPTVQAPIPAPAREPSSSFGPLVLAAIGLAVLAAIWLRRSDVPQTQTEERATTAKRAKPRPAREGRRARAAATGSAAGGAAEAANAGRALAEVEAALREKRFDEAASLMSALAEPGAASEIDLEPLRRSLVELALERGEALIQARDCAGLARLEGGLGSAGAETPQALRMLTERCEKALSFPVDGGTVAPNGGALIP